MRQPRVVFSRGSWRIREGGGFDKAGKYRGYDIEKLKSSEWVFQYHRISLAEAQKIIVDYMLLGKKPKR